jgi:tetratricopeptide (TPR) repeat protein
MTKMINKLAITGLLALTFTGCNSSAPQSVQNPNSNQAPQRNEKMQSVVSHTTENQPPPVGNSSNTAAGPKSKWTQSGNPIDTQEVDSEIARAVKAQKAKPTDAAANSALADAYFKRGFALTEARQYASALGDFRRVIKYDPENEEARGWIDQIITIYNSINKEYPKEGEEPPPLPFKKEK